MKMKRISFLLVLGFCLVSTGQAYATATYYAATAFEVDFSFTWQGDVAFTSSDNKTGTGEHFEEFGGYRFVMNNYAPHIPEDDLEFWVRMEVYADGFAGNPTGSANGTSEASNRYEYQLSYGLPYSFDLTMSILNNVADMLVGGGLPGESSSATAYNDILLNGVSIFNSFSGGSYTITIPAVTTPGTPTTITLITHAGGAAMAIYDSNIPEPATLALFGLGLAGIPFVRRRRTPA